MKKEDLKTGMVLEFGNGDRGLMLDDEIFLISKSSRKFGGSLSRSLIVQTTFKLREKIIVAVYVPNTPKNNNIGIRLGDFLFHSTWLDCVWKRGEEELTLSQVCKELGREIKIIKG